MQGGTEKHLPLALFGTEYWDMEINFDALARFGVIDAEDLGLIHRTDSVDDVFDHLNRELTEY